VGEKENRYIARQIEKIGIDAWREQRAVKARAWRASPGGKASYVRQGKRRDPNCEIFGSMIHEIIVETTSDNFWYRQASKAADEADEVFRKYQRAFFQKIFQPCSCVDCDQPFETTHPTEFWAHLVECSAGRKRCDLCRKRHRLANHGGGPRRRCKKFGVPYTHINPITIYERDSWTCLLCSKPIDKELLGQSKNPHGTRDRPLVAFICSDRRVQKSRPCL